MGRGNVCVNGQYEGLYYVDWDNFICESEDEDGIVSQHYDLQQNEWEDSLELFVEDFLARFKSFSRCEKNHWLDDSCRAVLENDLFYIGVEDNQWSMAIELLQKEQGFYDSGNFAGLQARHYQTYLDGIRDCLFNQFETLGAYSGAWTSKYIHRGEVSLCG
jgi:hypothetical protein